MCLNLKLKTTCSVYLYTLWEIKRQIKRPPPQKKKSQFHIMCLFRVFKTRCSMSGGGMVAPDWMVWVWALARALKFGSMYVSRKLPTYPSPILTSCPKREVSVNLGLGRGRWAISQKHTLIRKFCVLGQDTLLSQFLSPPRNTNE